VMSQEAVMTFLYRHYYNHLSVVVVYLEWRNGQCYDVSENVCGCVYEDHLMFRDCLQ
jgi:hypothetical protein